MHRESIIFDTDLALGLFGRDVDDGLALVMALNSPEINIEFITCVYGNAPLPKVRIQTDKLLDVYFGNDYEDRPSVYNGADRPLRKIKKRIYGKIRSGEVFPAVKKIAESLMNENYDNKPILLAIGPLTNVALLDILFPEAVRKLQKIVIMGGKIGGYEFNFANDPEATDHVFSMDVPKYVMGLEVCTAQMFTEVHYAELCSKGTPVAEYLCRNIKSWLKLNKMKFAGRKNTGFYPFDPCAVAYIIDPSLFGLKRIAAEYPIPRLRSRGNLLQKTILKEEDPVTQNESHILNWAFFINSEKFMKLLMDRLV